MNRSSLSLSLGLSMIIIGGGVARAGDSAVFRPLGVLDPNASPPGSFAFGVSADGAIVVGTSFIRDGKQSDTRAVSWGPDDAITEFPPPPDSLSSSMGSSISLDGAVIAGGTGFAIPPGYEIRNGVVWLQNNSMLIEIAGIATYLAEDVSDDGSVVVGVTREPGPFPIPRRAFLWSESRGASELGIMPGGTYTWARAVSADGSVVAGLGDFQGVLTAFRWTEATGVEVAVDTGGELSSEFDGISPSGRIIVGSLGNDAMYWTVEDNAVPMGSLPELGFCVALDLTANGSMIIGYCYGEAPKGFVWTPNDGMRRLDDVLVEKYNIDLAGWDIGFPTGISDDGAVLVGSGTNPDGVEEAWRIELPTGTSDLDQNQLVNVLDLLDLLAGWGPCNGGICLSDVNGDGVTNVFDLLELLGNWGT